jgi:type IX secretion system PorP/SprF family membrane protein
LICSLYSAFLNQSSILRNSLSIIVLFFSCSVIGQAQRYIAQLPPALSQYMFNPLSSNPAYAGFYDMTVVSNLFKGQIGNNFNLLTNSFNVHSSLPVDHLGAGFNATIDQAGITTSINLDLALSYKFQYKANKLSFGAQGSFFHLQNDFSKLTYDQSNNGSYEGLYIPLNNSTINKPNFGLGAMYAGRKFFGGISIPRLFSIQEDYQFGITADSSKKNYLSRYQPYTTASFGKIIHVKDKYEIKPSFMAKYVPGVSMLLDLNFSILLHQKLWLGSSLRNSFQNPKTSFGDQKFSFNTLALMGQVQVNSQFKVGFSYDLSLNATTIASQKGIKAPFEIMLNYNLATFNEQAVHTFLF